MDTSGYDRLSDYDFSFPESAVAQHPAPRGDSRILRVHRQGSDRRELRARDLAEEFRPGDLLVVNNTRVIPARIYGERAGGGKAEVLLVRPMPDPLQDAHSVLWEAMVKPGKAFRKNRSLQIGGVECRVEGERSDGLRLLRFLIPQGAFHEWLDSCGHVPLPPYIHRSDEPRDRSDYQPVFAKEPGAVAAPTASLHFDDGLVAALRAKGVGMASITLHVGPGTFRNIEDDDYRHHVMHSERFVLSGETADLINRTRAAQGRIVAIGTTVARVLETVADDAGTLHPKSGETSIFLYPGYRWKACDGLLTNFHWPRSSLILLVASFRGKSEVLEDYRYAVQAGFRLFSYGDGMLIL